MSEPVLLFVSGETRCAVSLADVTRLFVEHVLLPVPFSHPAMVGVAAAADAHVGARPGGSEDLAPAVLGTQTTAPLVGPGGGISVRTFDSVPVFDLRGLLGTAAPPRHVAGATVALFRTERGPVGLRLDRLVGTSAHYAVHHGSLDDAACEGAAPSIEIARTLTGTVQVDGVVFGLFSPEAFLAAVGL